MKNGFFCWGGNGKIRGFRYIDDDDDDDLSNSLEHVCLFKLLGLNVWMIPYNIHSSNDSSNFPLVIVGHSLIG